MCIFWRNKTNSSANNNLCLYEQWQNKQINIDELLQSSELCPLSAEKEEQNI